MQLLENIKKRWERLWLPKLQEGKTKIELDRDKKIRDKLGMVSHHTSSRITHGYCYSILDRNRTLYGVH